MSSRSVRRGLLVGLLVALALPRGVAGAQGALGSQCLGNATWAGDLASADELLANLYTFPPHPTVTLPEDPAWTEDPFGDRNWRHRYHSLNYVRHLWHAWKQTADLRYRDRMAFLLRDWFATNYRLPTSDFSWNLHSTAWRAMTYACAAEHLAPEVSLGEALEFHGRVLASQYLPLGNAAFNQSLGLLAVGCELGRRAWVQLATDRIRSLVQASVDDEGVNNEQSVVYHLYNYNRYGEGIERFQACGQAVPAELTERRALMPGFLAHATLPNREYEIIGDSHVQPATAIPGTTAEYAATAGASGAKPGGPYAAYRAGYAFGRSGWGEARPYADETFYSLRFGPPRRHHGHFDGGAVTLYGYGARLLLDSGFDRYEFDRWRDYFRSPAAHNVVTVDGTRLSPYAPTYLSAQRHNVDLDFYRVRHGAWRDVRADRRVLFSRRLGSLLVEDILSAPGPKTFRQLWHLAPDAAPTRDVRKVQTTRARANITLRWLGGAAPTLRILKGRTDPLQGWVAFEYGKTVAAPTVEATLRGSTAHYVTLIVPSEGPARRIVLRDVKLYPDGFRATITVGATTERVVVRGSAGSIALL